MTTGDEPSIPVLAPIPPMADRRRLVAVAALVLGLLSLGGALPLAFGAVVCAAFAWQGDGMSRLLAVIGGALGAAIIVVSLLPMMFAVFP
jgi:hypothetical protein